MEADGYEAEWQVDYAIYKQAQHLWKTTWPNYCRNCGGFGVKVVLSRAGEVSYPACDCIVQCACPRCANHLRVDTNETTGKQTIGPCGTCGWTELVGGVPTF